MSFAITLQIRMMRNLSKKKQQRIDGVIRPCHQKKRKKNEYTIHCQMKTFFFRMPNMLAAARIRTLMRV